LLQPLKTTSICCIHLLASGLTYSEITSNNWIIFYWLNAYFFWSIVVFLSNNSYCCCKSLIAIIMLFNVVICNSHSNLTCLVSREFIVSYFSLVIVTYMLQIVLVLGMYNYLLCNLSFLPRPRPTNR
jgi:hypothetical protein